MAVIRILFLSDTHLGFDEPVRPRVERRRRGPDFFESCERALAEAEARRVDAVVHAGDLFFRSRIPLHLAHRGLALLVRVAEAGIPVLLVPGNHERSQIPRGLLACHPRLLVFDRPRRFELELQGRQVTFVGFPFEAGDIRSRFPGMVAPLLAEGVGEPSFLCLHQLIEGARVGPVGYTFRAGEQVIRAADLPAGFAAILAGHVHRAQVLSRDLQGRQLPAPVIYAGSTERTSFAERDETKGWYLLELSADEGLLKWTFVPLPVRPMVSLRLRVEAADRDRLPGLLQAELGRLAPDSVVQVRLDCAPEPFPLAGAPGPSPLTATVLRRIVPPEMNLTLHWPRPASDPPPTPRRLL